MQRAVFNNSSTYQVVLAFSLQRDKTSIEELKKKKLAFSFLQALDVAETFPCGGLTLQSDALAWLKRDTHRFQATQVTTCAEAGG